MYLEKFGRICYRGQLHNTDSSLINFVSSGTSREHFGFPFLPVFASPLISSQSFQFIVLQMLNLVSMCFLSTPLPVALTHLSFKFT